MTVMIIYSVMMTTVIMTKFYGTKNKILHNGNTKVVYFCLFIIYVLFKVNEIWLLCQFSGFIIYFAYGVWFSEVEKTLPTFTLVYEKEEETVESTPLLKE